MKFASTLSLFVAVNTGVLAHANHALGIRSAAPSVTTSYGDCSPATQTGFYTGIQTGVAQPAGVTTVVTLGSATLTSFPTAAITSSGFSGTSSGNGTTYSKPVTAGAASMGISAGALALFAAAFVF